MGEWSEYFEDFPEEDEANYINGRFAPKAAAAARAVQARQEREQASLNATVSRLIREGKERAKSKAAKR